MIIIKKRKTSSNNDNYQSSISDLMSGLVFIFIITIVMFVIQFSDVTDKKNKALSEYNEINQARNSLLSELEKSLKQIGVSVIVDYENGILRLPEDALFESGQWNLKKDGVFAVKGLSKNIKELLNCKTTKIKNLCDDGTPKIEAIFVEGHSDKVKLGSRLRKRIGSNLNLSAQRAINTYRLMEQDVKDLKNQQRKALFSVAGYGSRRPAMERPLRLSKVERDHYNKMDRRIDLRFVMSIPKFLTIKE